MTTWEVHIDWAHALARPEDSIFLISGCTMPAILRKASEPTGFGGSRIRRRVHGRQRVDGEGQHKAERDLHLLDNQCFLE